ncbi:response regulator [Fischerella sp. JS2]|uniref:response regulator n=1 Tax=Fischerella sp. JS2 TaxID=2597771 RepID=UPI0028E7BE97|nr:response regulator [Fischerella sp. JS2]
MKTLQVLDGLRVLLVDDDADSLELVRFILEQYHAQVSSTASTCEALQVIRLWKPDILISDIAMPDEDGYSFIRNVRNLEGEMGQIPAIALTALVKQEAVAVALQAGFSTCIVKPFDPDQLVKVISNLLLQ